MKNTISICLSALFLCVVTNGNAQQKKGYADPATQQATQSEISAKDVAKFKKIQPKVENLRAELNKKMNKTKADKQEAVITEYNEKMVQLVVQNGLSPQKYNLIAAQQQSAK